MRYNFSILLVKIFVLLFALGALPGAKTGCGSLESNETLTSPVQAVTSLLERSDGTVEAELVLISTAANPHAFVDTARNPRVRMPDGTEIALSLTSSGHYTETSGANPLLVYEPGATYQFKFELDDESQALDVSGGNFVAVVDAPDDVVTFSLSEAPEFAGDTATLSWQPVARFGVIEIVEVASGEVVFSNFDFSAPQFDGSKWARLKSGGTFNLGVDVFTNPGDYEINFCAVDKVSDFDTELSAELGALSGFLIGRCAESIIATVP